MIPELMIELKMFNIAFFLCARMNVVCTFYVFWKWNKRDVTNLLRRATVIKKHTHATPQLNCSMATTYTSLWDRFAIHSPFVLIRRSFYCIITDGFPITLRFVETNTLNSVMDWGLMFKQIYFWQSRIQLFFHLSFSLVLPFRTMTFLSFLCAVFSITFAHTTNGWHHIQCTLYMAAGKTCAVRTI